MDFVTQLIGLCGAVLALTAEVVGFIREGRPKRKRRFVRKGRNGRHVKNKPC